MNCILNHSHMPTRFTGQHQVFAQGAKYIKAPAEIASKISQGAKAEGLQNLVYSEVNNFLIRYGED